MILKKSEEKGGRGLVPAILVQHVPHKLPPVVAQVVNIGTRTGYRQHEEVVVVHHHLRARRLLLLQQPHFLALYLDSKEQP